MTPTRNILAATTLLLTLSSGASIASVITITQSETVLGVVQNSTDADTVTGARTITFDGFDTALGELTLVKISRTYDNLLFVNVEVSGTQADVYSDSSVEINLGANGEVIGDLFDSHALTGGASCFKSVNGAVQDGGAEPTAVELSCTDKDRDDRAGTQSFEFAIGSYYDLALIGDFDIAFEVDVTNTRQLFRGENVTDYTESWIAGVNYEMAYKVEYTYIENETGTVPAPPPLLLMGLGLVSLRYSQRRKA